MNCFCTSAALTEVSSTISCSRPVTITDHVHTHVGQDLSHRQRVHQVGLARGAQLAFVIPGGKPVGFFYGGGVVFRAVVADSSEELLQLLFGYIDVRKGNHNLF